MKWGFATTAAIVRTLQKDLYYREELLKDFKLVLLDHLSVSWYFKAEEWLPLLVDLIYYGVQTGRGQRTLGEAFSRIAPVDTRSRRFFLESKQKRILWLISTVIFPFLLRKKLKSPKLLKAFDLLSSLNSVLFYYTGRFPSISNLLLQKRYIFYPRSPPMLDGDALLYKGFAILLAFVTLNKVTNTNQEDSKDQIKVKTKKKSSIQFKCPVCLEDLETTAFTSVKCGHIYCWHCITKWMLLLGSTGSCPVCRVPCRTTDLLPLINI